MMWNYYGGWNWIWMVPMMLVVWAAVVVFIVWAVRSFTGGRGPADPALETLRRRFASGEITQDEFEKNRRALGG